MAFSFGSAGAYEASFVPWSGYWWPANSGGLGTGADYHGRPAPLEKYNLLTTGITSGGALDDYMANFYDPSAPGWYGLCAYWARAASHENVVFWPSSEDNLIFRVGDKKGLLTLAHHQDLLEYGAGSQPDQFHFWLLNYIKDQGKSFVADLDPGEEVWSYPIFEYEMQTVRAGNVESVSTRIYYADDNVSPDFMGTKIRVANYTYDLFLDAGGAITGGEWTGNSISNHPDFLSFSLGVGDIFDGLDYNEILRLSGSRDDFLEQGSRNVDISPGTYHLVLLDEDVYTIPALPGDILSLGISKEPGSWKDIAAVVTDGNGDELLRTNLTSNSPLNDIFTVTTPPYTIRLTQEDYLEAPNIYTIEVDLIKSFQQEVPYIPTFDDWSGFALTNPGNVPIERVALMTRNALGEPIQTILGPLRLDPGEKQRFFFDDLPVRLTERYESDRLTLTADGPVELLNLIGDDEGLFLTTFVQKDARGSLLVIPDTAAPLSRQARMFGGIRNESLEDARVTLRLYSAAGSLQHEVETTIAANRWFPVIPGESPFYSMPASGWIEVQGTGEQILSGFQYTSDTSGVETMFAIPLSGTAKKIVPHIARPGYWTTKVTLINPQDTANPVTLHPALAGADAGADYDIILAPREKRTLEIQDLFGKMAGDPLYHSIVEITGLYPLTGYYTYSVPGGKDKASYPLLDENDFKEVLHLPHYAGNNGGFWWTGVVVCNPSVISQTVSIEPYDYNGDLMAGEILVIDLNAGAYDVFDVKSRFGEVASEISFINFRAGGDAGIGGFYLYGNRRNKDVLSGANM